MTHSTTKSKIKNINASKVFMALVIFAFFIISVFGTLQILSDTQCASCNVYKAIGFLLIMLWICIFLCYFIWAIYFYNFNLGKTNEEWDKINEAKNNRTKGLPFDQHDIDEEPKYNPYHEETFGLPSGTVRGMIAFTLLFGAIAMLIVSFGMNNDVQLNSFILDEFEFYKTAFLMMIAFYFGSRSLQYLKSGNKTAGKLGLGTEEENDTKSVDPKVKTSTQTTPAAESEIVVINNDAAKVKPRDGEVPPIVAIDPMAPTK
jgi:hypothetical protein